MNASLTHAPELLRDDDDEEEEEIDLSSAWDALELQPDEVKRMLIARKYYIDASGVSRDVLGGLDLKKRLVVFI